MQTPVRRFGVVTGFVLLLIALIANAWIIQSRLAVQIGNQNRMAQSREALFDLAQIELLLNEAESGQRGFLYTSDTKYLTPYYAAQSQIGSYLTNMANQLADSQVERADMLTLQNLTRKKLSELAQTTALYQAGKSQEAKKLVLSDAGLITMNDIRTIVDRMRQQETLREAERNNLYQRSKRVTSACIYLTSLGAALGLLLLAYHIRREMNAREEDGRQLRRSKDQLRALAARLETATEGERLRISRELHDQLGQALTGIKMDLDWIVRKQGGIGGIWVSMVQDSMKVVDSTISLVRRIATELRPEILDTFGLRAAIQWHSEQFQRRTGIVCIVAVPDSPLGIVNAHKIAVFRIFQEALTNIARHSLAKNILITLEREQNAAVMTVNDDGVGFVVDPLEPSESLGILGMRERAMLVGAEFLLESKPGHGTTVTLTIPLEEACTAEPKSYEHFDH